MRIFCHAFHPRRNTEISDIRNHSPFFLSACTCAYPFTITKARIYEGVNHQLYFSFSRFKSHRQTVSRQKFLPSDERRQRRTRLIVNSIANPLTRTTSSAAAFPSFLSPCATLCSFHAQSDLIDDCLFLHSLVVDHGL